MGKKIAGKGQNPAAGSPERQQIGVTALKGICVLFEDDIYELACWLLKMNTAKQRGTNSKSRHTVYGLTGVYSISANLSRETIIHVLESHGLPLGATIEYDEDVV
jgi:hypothetical protein